MNFSRTCIEVFGNTSIQIGIKTANTIPITKDVKKRKYNPSLSNVFNSLKLILKSPFFGQTVQLWGHPLFICHKRDTSLQCILCDMHHICRDGKNLLYDVRTSRIQYNV